MYIPGLKVLPYTEINILVLISLTSLIANIKLHNLTSTPTPKKKVLKCDNEIKYQHNTETIWSKDSTRGSQRWRPAVTALYSNHTIVLDYDQIRKSYSVLPRRKLCISIV